MECEQVGGYSRCRFGLRRALLAHLWLGTSELGEAPLHLGYNGFQDFGVHKSSREASSTAQERWQVQVGECCLIHRLLQGHRSGLWIGLCRGRCFYLDA